MVIKKILSDLLASNITSTISIEDAEVGNGMSMSTQFMAAALVIMFALGCVGLGYLVRNRIRPRRWDAVRGDEIEMDGLEEHLD